MLIRVECQSNGYCADLDNLWTAMREIRFNCCPDWEKPCSGPIIDHDRRERLLALGAELALVGLVRGFLAVQEVVPDLAAVLPKPSGRGSVRRRNHLRKVPSGKKNQLLAQTVPRWRKCRIRLVRKATTPDSTPVTANRLAGSILRPSDCQVHGSSARDAASLQGNPIWPFCVLLSVPIASGSPDDPHRYTP